PHLISSFYFTCHRHRPTLFTYTTLFRSSVHIDNNNESFQLDLKGGGVIKVEEHIIVTINGKEYLAHQEQNLLDLINSTGKTVPQICYNESLGPIQTCDTCLVEVDGKIVRACGTKVKTAMQVNTNLELIYEAQKEALDSILEKHELYCTVCDYNNGDCEIHNAIADFGIEHQSRSFKPKPYEIDDSG